jgi:hypothetical protein
MNNLDHHPGGTLIAAGIDDCHAGRVTPAACLISIGWSRMERAGLDLSNCNSYRIAEPEFRLYRLLGTEPGDPYSRYNALIRELVSFEHSLEHEQARLLGGRSRWSEQISDL